MLNPVLAYLDNITGDGGCAFARELGLLFMSMKVLLGLI
jgi:hypothetical protein